MKTFARHLPGLLVLSIIFIPDFKSINPVRIDDLFIVIGIILIYIKKDFKKTISKENLFVGKSFIKMAIACVLGIFIGGLVLGLNVVGRDFIIFVQMLKYYTIFWILSNMRYDHKIIIIFYLYVLIALTAGSTIAIAQYWNIAGVNEWLTPLYFSKELALQQMVEAEMDFRVAGTMSNPNYYAYMIVWLIVWVVSLNYYYKKIVNIYIPVITLLMSSLAILLIQSRTTMISAIVIIVILTLLTKNIKTKLRIISIFGILATSMFYIYSSEGMTERGFGQRLNLGSDSASVSFGARNRDLITPLIIMTEVPVIIPFGLGPAKTVIRRDSHNGYTWVAIRMGIYGMLVYIALVFRKIKKGNALRKNQNIHWEFRSIGLAALLCVIPWINGDLTGNVLKEIQLMSLNMVSLGMLQYALNNYNILSNDNITNNRSLK